MKHEKRVMVANIYRCAKGNEYRNIPDSLVPTIKKHFTGINANGDEYRMVFQSESMILDHIKKNIELNALVDRA